MAHPLFNFCLVELNFPIGVNMGNFAANGFGPMVFGWVGVTVGLLISRLVWPLWVMSELGLYWLWSELFKDWVGGGAYWVFYRWCGGLFEWEIMSITVSI